MTLFNVERASLIVPGFHPDPSVCELERDHFLVVFSSFEYVPGLPIYESFDAGLTWSFLTNALTRPSQYPCQTMDNSRGIFAPTLRRHDGILYLIVTNVDKGNMMINSRDEGHTWSDPLWITDWPGIDPSIFIDDDERAYICGNEASEDEIPGIYMSEIDLETGSILTSRRRISSGITGANPEGPHMYRRGETYFLMWAEGGTEAGHMECLSRSDSPFGPYEMFPGNPMMTNRSTHLSPSGIGHADLARIGEKRTFMVFLGTRMTDDYPAQGWIGREPFCAWWDWDESTGWPTISDQSYEYDNSLEDDRSVAVDSGECDPREWVTPGVDREGLFDVREDANSTVIDITAVENDFGNKEHVPFIGRRLYGFTDCFEVSVAKLCEGETGIIVFANKHHWISLAIVRGEGDSKDSSDLDVRLVARDGDLFSVVGNMRVSRQAEGLPIQLRVTGDFEGFNFFVGSSALGRLNTVDDGDKQENLPLKMKMKKIGSINGKIFSFANAGGFTGTLFGVYAHGKGKAEFKVGDFV
jgi:alpha-N-arabinofuranosidase